MRKVVAQTGVVLFILQMLGPIYAPYIQYVTGQWTLPVFIGIQMGICLLVIAAIIPQKEGEEWGSIWPLAGYDNAIDAIYTRGPWWVRLDELAEQERERGIAAGMNTLFGGQ